MERELINPSPEAIATPDDFRQSLMEFRSEVYDFFARIAPRYKAIGIDTFNKTAPEFDERLFYMSLGLKEDLEPSDYQHLIEEMNKRKEVIVSHYDNPDIIRNAYSLGVKFIQSTKFVQASMIGNKALSSDAMMNLKKLDEIPAE